jgi:hypothetical protein
MIKFAKNDLLKRLASGLRFEEGNIDFLWYDFKYKI